MKRKIFSILFALVLVLSLSLIPAALVGADPGPGIVGLWHLDEGTGTTASDSSGNGNDGTLLPTTSEPTWVSGKSGNALSFDGVNDYVEVPHHSSLDITSAMTVEVWVKLDYPAADGSINAFVDKCRGGKANNAWFLRWDDRGTWGVIDAVAFYISSGGNWYKTWVPNGITDNDWHYIVGTFDKDLATNQQKLYIDGVEVASVTNTSAMTGNALPLYIGWQDMQIATNMHGIIDEVRIWDQALTADQVFQSYITPDIEKVLVDSDTDLTPDTNLNGIDEVALGTLYTFTMDITVTNNTGLTLSDVVVHDRLGAELHLDSTTPSWVPPGQVGPVIAWTRGKTAKWFIDWTIDSLLGGESATLTITALLDQNPGGHQEYSSPGVYDLNSGATIVSAYIDGVFVEFEDIQTDPIQVEAMGTEGD